MKNVVIGLVAVAAAIGIGALIMKSMKNKANIPGKETNNTFGAAAKGMTNKQAREKQGWSY